MQAYTGINVLMKRLSYIKYAKKLNNIYLSKYCVSGYTTVGNLMSDFIILIHEFKIYLKKHQLRVT